VNQALENVRGVVELPEETRQRLEELRILSKAAEDGDKGARRKLRGALLESSPEVIARASDVGRKSRLLLAATLAGGDPLAECALSAQMDLLRADLAGENPTPLEDLLAERIASTWILHELLEVLNSAQLLRGTSEAHRIPHSFHAFYIRWQETAHRQLLRAIRTLAQVRKLQINTPAIQYNTQVHLRQGGVA
jgi:hypothetical protein